MKVKAPQRITAGFSAAATPRVTPQHHTCTRNSVFSRRDASCSPELRAPSTESTSSTNTMDGAAAENQQGEKHERERGVIKTGRHARPVSLAHPFHAPRSRATANRARTSFSASPIHCVVQTRVGRMRVKVRTHTNTRAVCRVPCAVCHTNDPPVPCSSAKRPRWRRRWPSTRWPQLWPAASCPSQGGQTGGDPSRVRAAP